MDVLKRRRVLLASLVGLGIAGAGAYTGVIPIPVAGEMALDSLTELSTFIRNFIW